MKLYGIASGTLSKWISDSSNIIAKVQGGSGKVKKAIPTPFPKTDSAMLKWFTEQRNNDVAVDSRLFRVQAVQFSQKLGESEFNDSDGFVAHWKKRHNVVHRTISGEAQSVELATVEEFRYSIPDNLLQEYPAINVFNCDEAGRRVI